MKLNQNSIHAKLYREFYSTKILPDNLCPFFWKLVLAWVCSPFYMIIGYPIKRDWIVGKIVIWIFIVAGVLIALIILAFIGVCHYHLFKAVFNFYSYDHRLANIAWQIDLITFLPMVIGFITDKINKKKREYIVAEFIKAKYSRYCPHITWK